MQDFIPALTALLPGVDQNHLWSVNSSLQSAETALNSAIAELTEARDALRNAKGARSTEHANLFLGEAFSVAMNPGASGTVSSNVERANAALSEARTAVQILDRFATQEA